MRILDPLTGEVHENVYSLHDYRMAMAPVKAAETYEQKVARLKIAILKATGQQFAIQGDPGDERDVGC